MLTHQRSIQATFHAAPLLPTVLLILRYFFLPFFMGKLLKDSGQRPMYRPRLDLGHSISTHATNYT